VPEDLPDGSGVSYVFFGDDEQLAEVAASGIAWPMAASRHRRGMEEPWRRRGRGGVFGTDGGGDFRERLRAWRPDHGFPRRLGLLGFWLWAGLAVLVEKRVSPLRLQCASPFTRSGSK